MHKVANQCWLVAQYNCLEFKNFARLWLLKMLSFWCKKNSLSVSIPLLLEVLYMEQPDDGFLNLFLLNMCAARIKAFTVPVHFIFIQEILMEGFVLKKNFRSYSFVVASWKNPFQKNFNFGDNQWQKLWDSSPLPPYSMLVAIWQLISGLHGLAWLLHAWHNMKKPCLMSFHKQV